MVLSIWQPVNPVANPAYGIVVPQLRLPRCSVCAITTEEVLMLQVSTIEYEGYAFEFPTDLQEELEKFVIQDGHDGGRTSLYDFKFSPCLSAQQCADYVIEALMTEWGLACGLDVTYYHDPIVHDGWGTIVLLQIQHKGKPVGQGVFLHKGYFLPETSTQAISA